MSVLACRGQTADRNGVSGRARYWIRFALSAVALLTIVASFTGEASAQCGGGGPGPIVALPPCPTTNSASANSHLSADAGLLDLGTQFMQRFNALSSFRTAASSANNPQGGGAEPDAERYRTWF
jgi:hypothetical protein